MRILYLSPWFPYPLDTGSRIRVYHMLRALAERHRVTLLTLDPQGWAPAQVEVVAPLCEHMAIVRRDPFRRRRPPVVRRLLSTRPIVADPFPELLDMAQQLHAVRPFDVVIAASVAMSAYALGLPSVPRILEEHNSNTRWMHERYRAQRSVTQRLRCWVSWRKSALYESRFFRRFDLVTMVSEQDARTACRLLPAGYPSVRIVPNGVDCCSFRPGLATPKSNTLVFGGGLVYHVNYQAVQWFLGQVYPRVRQRFPDAELHITGSTNSVNLDGLCLDDSVTLTGFVQDVRHEIASACVSVVPILSGGGTRIKILEAMALGTPVVTTSKGAEGLEVVDGQHVLLADTPQDFADQTVRLLRDTALRSSLAASARRLVEERYDWQDIGQRFTGLIEATVSRGRESHL